MDRNSECENGAELGFRFEFVAVLDVRVSMQKSIMALVACIASMFAGTFFYGMCL